MKKRSIIILTLLAGCFTNSFAQKGEKTLTVEVSNEWTQKIRPTKPIVIDLNKPEKQVSNIKSATVWEGNKRNSVPTGRSETVTHVLTNWLSSSICQPKATKVSV